MQILKKPCLNALTGGLSTVMIATDPLCAYWAISAKQTHFTQVPLIYFI